MGKNNGILCAPFPASHLHGRGRGLTCLTGNPIGSALEDHGRPVDCAIKGSNKTLEWSLQDKQIMFQISSQLPRCSKELRQLQCSSNHLGFAQKWVTKGPIKIESVFVLNHIKTCFFFFFSGYDNILNHFKHYQPPRKDEIQITILVGCYFAIFSGVGKFKAMFWAKPERHSNISDRSVLNHWIWVVHGLW